MANQAKLFSVALAFLSAPYLFVIATTHANSFSLISFFPDDAFYYLQTAYTFVHEGLISFDGTNPTTGFHPLQFLLASLASVFLSKKNVLIFFFLLNALALALSFFLLLKAHAASLKTTLFASLLTLPLFNLYLFTSSGLESALLLITWSIFYFLLIRTNFAGELSHSRALLLGIAISMVMLTRLDMVIPLSLFGIYVLYQAAASRRYGQGLLFIVAALLILAPYFLWMYKFQGNIFPISSIAKFGRDRWDIAQVIRTLSGGTAIGLVLMLFPVVVAVYAIFAKGSSSDTQQPIVKLAGVASILYFVYVLLLAHEPFRWYLNFSFFVAVDILIWILAKGIRVDVSLRTASALAVVCFVINAVTLNAWARTQTTSAGLLQMSNSLSKIVPEDSSLATNDAGVVGYYSQFRVHNLDGLVNSYANWRTFLSKQDYLGYTNLYDIHYLLLRPEVYESWLKTMDANSVAAQLVPVATFDVPRFGTEILLKLNHESMAK